MSIKILIKTVKIVDEFLEFHDKNFSDKDFNSRQVC